MEEDKKKEVLKAIKKYKPEGILILGTSDGMVEKIAANLGLPKIEKIVYIQDYATQEEMEEARRMRLTFELKKDFSGYILDPLQIFKHKGKGDKPYVAEKSMIRPTFSYMGKFTISDTVFRQIIEHIAKKEKGIYRVTKTRVSTENQVETIYLEVILMYCYNIKETLTLFREKSIKEIEKYTAMTVEKMDIVAKGIQMPENN